MLDSNAFGAVADVKSNCNELDSTERRILANKNHNNNLGLKRNAADEQLCNESDGDEDTEFLEEFMMMVNAGSSSMDFSKTSPVDENMISDASEEKELQGKSNLWNFHRRILFNKNIKTDSDPRYLYRFYQLNCEKCEKNWKSPLTKAEIGLFCPTCSTFIRPSKWKDYATPYIGPHLCFGQFRCHKCNSSWNSQRSIAHSGQMCYYCGTLNFPIRQMPILQKLEQWRRNAERLEEIKLNQPQYPDVLDDDLVLYPPDEQLAPPSKRAKWNTKVAYKKILELESGSKLKLTKTASTESAILEEEQKIEVNEVTVQQKEDQSTRGTAVEVVSEPVKTSNLLELPKDLIYSSRN